MHTDSGMIKYLQHGHCEMNNNKITVLLKLITIDISMKKIK